MRKIVLILNLILVANFSFSQAKKPTLMIAPSDVWCNQRGFMIEQDNMGTTYMMPDYSKALISDPDLQLAISKIGEMMAERGFPLKDLASTLKSIQTSRTENMVLAEELGGIKESSLDMLRRVARADIWLNLTWSVTEQGPKKSVTFNLQGIDAYTNKQIAASSGTGEPSFSAELPLLIEEAIIAHIDQFNSQLQEYFDEMAEIGREVSLECLIANSSSINFDSEIGNGDTFSFLMEDLIGENSVEGRFNTSDVTENRILFEQIRIPLESENGRALDMRTWTRNLQRELLSKYRIKSKLVTKGLGQAYLIIEGSAD